MNKIKNCIMLLLSVSTDKELQSMLQEDCFNGFTKECIKEEIENRRKGGVASEIS